MAAGKLASLDLKGAHVNPVGKAAISVRLLDLSGPAYEPRNAGSLKVRAVACARLVRCGARMWRGCERRAWGVCAAAIGGGAVRALGRLCCGSLPSDRP